MKTQNQPSKPKRGRPPTDPTSASTHIHFRTTPARKAAWTRAAHPQTLTDWLTTQCDRAARYTP